MRAHSRDGESAEEKKSSSEGSGTSRTASSRFIVLVTVEIVNTCHFKLVSTSRLSKNEKGALTWYDWTSPSEISCFIPPFR